MTYDNTLGMHSGLLGQQSFEPLIGAIRKGRKEREAFGLAIYSLLQRRLSP